MQSPWCERCQAPRCTGACRANCTEVLDLRRLPGTCAWTCEPPATGGRESLPALCNFFRNRFGLCCQATQDRCCYGTLLTGSDDGRSGRTGKGMLARYHMASQIAGGLLGTVIRPGAPAAPAVAPPACSLSASCRSTASTHGPLWAAPLGSMARLSWPHWAQAYMKELNTPKTTHGPHWAAPPGHSGPP